MSSGPAYIKAFQRHFSEACARTGLATPAGLRYPASLRLHLGQQTHGAEQGDVFGTISSALVLGIARAERLTECASSLFEHKGVCDEWCVDDGQAVVRPALFDSWLRALDMAPFLFLGATRDTLEGLSRTATPTAQLASCARPERRHEFQGWDTYVRRIVQVLNPDDNASALSASFSAPLDHINAQVRQAVECSTELRQAILSRGPRSPLRWCSPDSARMSPNSPYHLRLNGDTVDHSLLATFDSQLRSASSARP